MTQYAVGTGVKTGARAGTSASRAIDTASWVFDAP
jgi:hypothetical protein